MNKHYVIVRYDKNGIDDYYHPAEDLFLPDPPNTGFTHKEVAEAKKNSLDLSPEHTYAVERLY